MNCGLLGSFGHTAGIFNVYCQENTLTTVSCSSFFNSLSNSKEQSRTWEANKSSASKEIPFYGRWRVITTSTSACHLSLSWATSIQSVPPSHFVNIHFIWFSHLHVGLQSGVFPSGFLSRTLYTPLLCPYMLHSQPMLFFLIQSSNMFGEDY